MIFIADWQLPIAKWKAQSAKSYKIGNRPSPIGN
jgi:hypothetical protein